MLRPGTRVPLTPQQERPNRRDDLIKGGLISSCDPRQASVLSGLQVLTKDGGVETALISNLIDLSPGHSHLPCSSPIPVFGMGRL